MINRCPNKGIILSHLVSNTHERNVYVERKNFSYIGKHKKHEIQTANSLRDALGSKENIDEKFVYLYDENRVMMVCE